MNEQVIQKWRERLRILRLFVLPIFMVFSIAFTESKYQNRICKGIEINITDEDESMYISSHEISLLINSLGNPEVVGHELNQVSASTINARIEENPFVAKTRTITSHSGVISILIEQQKPILRVFNRQNQSFYLTQNGTKAPLSSYQTARVPVATGQIEEPIHPIDSFQTAKATELLKLAQYLDKHSFFQSLTGQIIVEPNQEIIILTKMLERHKIILGNCDNLDEKMNKLQLFYTKVLPLKGWDYYSYIDLRYKNQIIAKK